MTLCLEKGERVGDTFVPVCMLPKGHDGPHNWPERIALRDQLRAQARQA